MVRNVLWECQLTPPQHRFHNPNRVQNALTGRPKSLERALEEAVSRAVRDNLAPLQRTADELHQAYADLVAACSSTRPSNALPAMLRAQTAASSLAAGLSVLSNFVTVALNSREHHAYDVSASSDTSTAVLEEEEEASRARLNRNRRQRTRVVRVRIRRRGTGNRRRSGNSCAKSPRKPKAKLPFPRNTHLTK